MSFGARYLILGLLDEVSEQYVAAEAAGQAAGGLTGYDISSVIKARVGAFWKESNGQLYPELARMLKEGLIQEAESSVLQAPGSPQTPE